MGGLSWLLIVVGRPDHCGKNYSLDRKSQMHKEDNWAQVWVSGDLVAGSTPQWILLCFFCCGISSFLNSFPEFPKWWLLPMRSINLIPPFVSFGGGVCSSNKNQNRTLDYANKHVKNKITSSKELFQKWSSRFMKCCWYFPLNCKEYNNT